MNHIDKSSRAQSQEAAPPGDSRMMRRERLKWTSQYSY